MGFYYDPVVTLVFVFSRYASSIIGEVSGIQGVGDGSQVGVPGN